MSDDLIRAINAKVKVLAKQEEIDFGAYEELNEDYDLCRMIRPKERKIYIPYGWNNLNKAEEIKLHSVST